MSSELLDIVNTDDQVISQASRTEAHENFLCHRVASIWFYNDAGEILLQKRSTKKDTFGGTYSISASGHVDAGHTVEETAVREIQEETGIAVTFSDLTFLEKKIVAYPPLNHFGNYFAYRCNATIDSLRFDPEEVEGFQWLPAEELYTPHHALRNIMHPFIISREHVSIYIKLLQHMNISYNEEAIRNNANQLS